MKLGQDIGSRFAWWGRCAARRPWALLAAAALATAGLLAGIPGIHFDASIESMLRQDDPTRRTYDAFRSQYASDERVIVLAGGDVFSLPFLTRLRALHEAIEAHVPHVEDVTSLVNARRTHGEEGELRVGDFLEEWPQSAEALAALRALALANPTYRNALVSEAGDYAVISVEVAPGADLSFDPLDAFDDGGLDAEVTALATPLATDGAAFDHVAVLGNDETQEIMDALLPLIELHEASDFQLWVTGSPTMNWVTVDLLRRDMPRFTALSLATMAVLLLALFGRVAGVALSLGVVVLALAATAGVMGWSGLPITSVTQILPSLLLATGIGFAVHLLTRFFARFDEGSSRAEAVEAALRQSGFSITLTSVTTAGGLASFHFADLAILSEFGTIAPAGVLLALAYTLSVVPALLIVLPLRRRPQRGRSRSVLERALLSLGGASTEHPHRVLAVWGVLLAAGAFGAAQLQISHAPVEWIPEGNPYRRAFERINQELRSPMSIEVLVDSGVESGLADPELLRGLERVGSLALDLEVSGITAGSALSIADLMKETHQALHDNDPAYYAIPGERRLAAQELLLLEQSGPDELAKVADSTLRQARLSILVNYADAFHYAPWIEALRLSLPDAFGPEVRIEITGRTMLMVRSMEGVLRGMMRSYGAALLVILPVMVLAVGGVGLGLTSMIPNIVPIVIAMGAMWLFAIPLDVFTALIGSICIGVSVDDTIHFMHGFTRHHRRTGDVRVAVRETLSTTGRALLFTTIVLFCGFLVFVFAGMQNLANFGLIAALTVVAAFLADVTLVPAALCLLVGRDDATQTHGNDLQRAKEEDTCSTSGWPRRPTI